jgi:hypothetical protein
MAWPHKSRKGSPAACKASPVLQQPVISEAVIILIGNYQMIEELNIHKVSGFFDFLRDL